MYHDYIFRSSRYPLYFSIHLFIENFYIMALYGLGNGKAGLKILIPCGQSILKYNYVNNKKKL